jgi:hypothetical protein
MDMTEKEEERVLSSRDEYRFEIDTFRSHKQLAGAVDLLSPKHQRGRTWVRISL